MRLRRRHAAPLTLSAVFALALLPLMASDCAGVVAPDDEERKACEAVCDAEDQCHAADPAIARSKDDCLAALCDEAGFKTLDDGESSVDFETLLSNECEKNAADCAELLLCSCPDACARVDQCAGSQTATCVDDCDNLIEQDVSLYTENRCKMESTCADLAACGQVAGGG